MKFALRINLRNPKTAINRAIAGGSLRKALRRASGKAVVNPVSTEVGNDGALSRPMKSFRKYHQSGSKLGEI
ncbi:hypothetical protein [Parasphingopyxis sp.]|uniref:hypothetical protein n=1 Tax=Parasphingopyxis sp. TaxID=1920299 RepID=UPI003F9F2304